MIKLNTITVGDFRLEPPNAELNPHDDKLVHEFLELFSHEELTKYNENYRLSSIHDAQTRIYNISLSFMQHRFYTYRLYDAKADKLVGTIELLTPESVNESHPSISKFCFPTGDAVRNNIWLIEYYLHPDYWRQGIMSNAVSAIIDMLFAQTARCVTAVCHIKNGPGEKFLKNLTFVNMIKYKNMKHHSLWIKRAPRD